MFSVEQLTEEQIHDQFMNERTKGLGGTCMSVVAGVNPYKDIIELYQEKLGLVPPIEANIPMRYGIYLEPTLIRLYEEETGLIVKKLPVNNNGDCVLPNKYAEIVNPHTGMIRDTRFPWLYAHCDGFVFNQNDELIKVLEAKTANKHVAYKWGEEGSDIVPVEYRIQTLTYSGISGLPLCDFAAAIAGEFKMFTTEFNKDLYDPLVTLSEDFWNNNILKQVPPELDGTDSYKKYITSLYPQHTEDEIEATEEIDSLAHELKKLQDDEKNIDFESQKVKNKIMLLMGENRKIKGIRYSFTWTTPKDRVIINYVNVVNDLKDMLAGFVSSEIVEEKVKSFIENHSISKEGSRTFRPNLKKLS